MHSVVLLFSYDDLHSSQKVEHFRDLYFTISGDYEIQPIVLLTKIDKVDKYEPLAVEVILDSGPIKEALNLFN